MTVDFIPKDPPTIIIGPHRSGTTLLTSMLRELRFFIGARTDSNQESLFFLERNEWLLRRTGGSWDYPQPSLALHRIDSLKAEATRVMHDSVHSFQFLRYTGAQLRLFGASGFSPEHGWGWKDPRNIFTLPIWTAVFPGAKLLYINRNGVDVAASLFRRERRAPIARSRKMLSIKPLFLRFLSALNPFERFFYPSARCTSLENCFRVWEEYTEEAEQQFEHFPGCKHSLSFERLVEHPTTELSKIVSFLGVCPGDADIEKAASVVNSDRAFAFMHDESLSRFYNNVRTCACMKRLYYDDVMNVFRS